MDCLPASFVVAVGDFNYRKRGSGSQVPRQGRGTTLSLPCHRLNRRKKLFPRPTHALCVKKLDARWPLLALARPDSFLMTYM